RHRAGRPLRRRNGPRADQYGAGAAAARRTARRAGPRPTPRYEPPPPSRSQQRTYPLLHRRGRRIVHKGQEHGWRGTASRGPVAGPHLEAGPDEGGEIGFVDDEQIRAGHAGTPLARHLVSAGYVDYEDLPVDQPAAERRGEVVAATLNQDQVERPE